MLYTDKIFERGIDLAKKTSFIQRDSFPDSGIIFQNPNKKPIKKIAVGIDVSVAELLYAKQEGCDLVIAHHPIGKASLRVSEEMLYQIKNLSFYGVKEENVKSEVMHYSESERRSSMANNFYREIGISEKLDIDLIVLHTPMDIIGVESMNSTITKNNCVTLKNCIEALNTLDEFLMASKFGQKAFIANGDENSEIGKISFSEFLGAQEASPQIFKQMKDAGIKTILAPHLSEDFFQAAKECGLQIIYCGHSASDSVGMNIFLNALLKENTGLKIIPLGGLLRN